MPGKGAGCVPSQAGINTVPQKGAPGSPQEKSLIKDGVGSLVGTSRWLSTPVWGGPGASSEVVEQRVKLLVCVLGLAFTSFAFAGKYHHKRRTSVIPQTAPVFPLFWLAGTRSREGQESRT